MTKFIIQKSPDEQLYFSLSYPDIEWTGNKEIAIHYSSKYAARRHMRDIELPSEALVVSKDLTIVR